MTVSDQNWNYQIDLRNFEESSLREFEVNINNIYQEILNILDDKLTANNDGFNNKNCTKIVDVELKTLKDSNKQIKKQLNMKDDELSQQQKQYENYKQDRKLLSKEIKETHETFLMAKKYYKKYLNIYFTIESRKNETLIVLVQFFTVVKKDADDYSVRLQRNTKNGKYELLEIKPQLDNFKDLQKRLHTTNYVAEVICSIRFAFLSFNNKK